MRSLRFSTVAVAAMSLLSLIFPASVLANQNSGRGGGSGLPKGAEQTVLQIYSPSQAVDVVLKLPLTSSFGCGPTNPVTGLVVQDIRNHNVFTLHAISPTDPTIGYFNLPAGRTVSVAPTQPFTCLEGMLITFVVQGQCPCHIGAPFNPICSDPTHPFGNPSLILANGVNLAEATVNVPAPFQETADISCNQGANSTINIKFSPGSSTPWNDGGGGNNNVTSVTNSYVDVSHKIDKNCNLSGVFAYNLSDCTGGATVCADATPFCSTSKKLCQIQRLGSGGTMLVTYLGPLAPPP